jgi:beta-galactosidase
MIEQKFMRAILPAIFVGVAMAQPTLSVWSANAPSTLSQEDPRSSLTFSSGWRFSLSQDDNGSEPLPDASSWMEVSVPHTWNRVGYYMPDTLGRVNTPATINKTQGIGWYRLSFVSPRHLRGKKAWLEFDAASRTAEVWLNGIHLGNHAGGFSRFRLDATNAIRPGAPNLLVVRTDNRRPTAGGPTADVLPLSGDFFVHGGLYRPVRLVVTDAIHFDMLDYGGPGVYASTSAIADGRAQIAVRARVVNDATRAAPVTIEAALLDERGAVAATMSRQASLAAGETSVVETSLSVERARLWQGVTDPYLYRLVVEIRGANGRVLDRFDRPFGIRQMRFDPKQGFTLNGQLLRLHGVGLHQDLEGKGWAMTREDIEADVRLIREMGANTIRLTHYQHGTPIHEFADRDGLILWDEIPLVSVWTLSPGQSTATEGLLANARQQLRELIRQNFNHASVAVWGIGNELDFGNSMPQFLAGGQGVPPDPLPLLNEMNRLAKLEDPTRLTALANCCEGRLFASNVEIPNVAPTADLAGANRYFGWYYGKVDDLGRHLDETRKAHPSQPLALAEYGAGGAISIHTDNPLGATVDSRGRFQPEEYQNYLHERSWAAIASRSDLSATWLWNSFDFATTVRKEGDSEDINTKGLVTYDRMVKKDAFFFYKANWATSPTVHVTGRRYVDRVYPVTDVRLYSNAPETELRVNGRTLGSQKDCPVKVCVWPSVQLREGTNDILAIGRFGHQTIEDRVEWRIASGEGARFRIDSGTMVAAKAKSGLYGSDHFFEGGESKSVNRSADYGRPAERKVILGTEEPDVAATYREGTFAYRIPTGPGNFRVKLTFVEPMAPAGQRQFDVIANGQKKLQNLDVAQAAGAPLKALERSFDVRVADGELKLQFAPAKGSAIVSAVEVERR